jgi:hypothetical protein
VIDTIAIDERVTNGGRPAWSHSDQEHVVEPPLTIP